MPEEKPELKRQEGYTLVDVVINLSLGVTARTSMHLVKECRKYKNRKIFFKKENPAPKLPDVYDGKNMFEVLCLGVARGDRLQIYVEGEDKEAEKLALRLYSAFSSVDSYVLDFDRFERDKILET